MGSGSWPEACAFGGADESRLFGSRGEETFSVTLKKKSEVRCVLTVEDESATMVDIAARSDGMVSGKFGDE